MTLRRVLKELQADQSKLLAIARRLRLHCVYTMPCSTERFCLIYWTEENSVTSVPRDKVMEAEIEVGGACRVKQGRKMYNGKIAAIGKRIVGQAKYILMSAPSPQNHDQFDWPLFEAGFVVITSPVK